jgi:hypothetical protein
MYPGERFGGSVQSIMIGSGAAQFVPSGKLPSSEDFQKEENMLLRVSLDAEALEKLKFGTSCELVVFTNKSNKVFEIIRKPENQVDANLFYFYIFDFFFV